MEKSKTKSELKRSEAGMMVDLMEELDDGDKRELLGYAKCLHWTNSEAKSDTAHDNVQTM